MKALLINGSPHEKGCTYTALRELADTLEAEGIETEIVQAGKTAHACNACASCKKTHRCVYDDLVNETAPKFAQADALVIGSPVYYASPAGGAIAFMDRLFFSTPYIDKTMKVGASVVSCRRGCNTATFDALNKSMLTALLEKETLADGLTVPDAIRQLRVFEDCVSSYLKNADAQARETQQHNLLCRQTFQTMLYGLIARN